MDINSNPLQAGAVDDNLLHLVSRLGEVDEIRILIQAGAAIDQKGDLGNTPLHYAAMAGQSETVKTLLLLGANKTLTNEFNQTAYDVALQGDYDDIAAMLNS